MTYRTIIHQDDQNGDDPGDTEPPPDTPTRMEHVNMSIETLEQTELSDEERLHLQASSERWKKMSQGQHLQDWLDFLPDLQAGRRLAMRYAGVVAPEGRGYAEGFSMFLARWFGDIGTAANRRRRRSPRARPTSRACCGWAKIRGAWRCSTNCGGRRPASTSRLPRRSPPARR